MLTYNLKSSSLSCPLPPGFGEVHVPDAFQGTWMSFAGLSLSNQWAAMLTFCIFHWPARASKDFLPDRGLPLWAMFSLLHPSLLSCWETMWALKIPGYSVLWETKHAGESCPMGHETTTLQPSCCQQHFQNGNTSCRPRCFGLSDRHFYYF